MTEKHRYTDLMDVDLDVHNLIYEDKKELSKSWLEMYAYFSQHRLMRKKIGDVKESNNLYRWTEFQILNKQFVRLEEKEKPVTPK